MGSGASGWPRHGEGTPWVKVLQTLVAYRLIDPGWEWRLHRQWFDASAMADLLEADFALAEKNMLYRCLDRLVEHKDDLFRFLVQRWGELFEAQLRCAALRPDEHVLRDRHRTQRIMICASSATAATSAATAAKW